MTCYSPVGVKKGAAYQQNKQGVCAIRGNGEIHLLKRRNNMCK